ncbi:helix-turn-helix domain-containing protein [Sporosarcina sp. FSL K6-3508]|uniref:helix-turn-helix transcriptional regulator n=1 Tax=Sporosarcina sp. FSL K6-3508 TaxID=2921557 RepID=UPI003159BCAE
MSNKLRKVREEIGMPLTVLAKRAKTSRQTLTNIELHGQEPGVYLALSIAKALKVDPRDIFFDPGVIQGLQSGVEEVV